MTARRVANGPKPAYSTVAAVLNYHRMGKRKQLGPKEPVRRYERAAPGDPLHLDIKKTGQV